MFLQEAAKLHRAEVRTFCMVVAYTGCRLSEALELTPDRIDFSTKSILPDTQTAREGTTPIRTGSRLPTRCAGAGAPYSEAAEK